MTRRVPNEWFSLCTTKSPACPTVPHFALSSTYAPFLFFRSLISFVPPVPTPCPFVLLPIPRILSFPRYRSTFLLLIPRGQTIYTVSSLFSFSPPSFHPRRSLSLLPYFNFFPFFIFPFPSFFFFFGSTEMKIHDSRGSFDIFNNFLLCLNLPTNLRVLQIRLSFRKRNERQRIGIYFDSIINIYRSWKSH